MSNRILTEGVNAGEGLSWEMHVSFSRETKPIDHPAALPAFTVVAEDADKQIVPWNPAAANGAPEKTVYGVLYEPYDTRKNSAGDVVLSKIVCVERFAIVYRNCLAFPAGVDAAGTAANLAAAIAGLLAKQIKVR